MQPPPQPTAPKRSTAKPLQRPASQAAPRPVIPLASVSSPARGFDPILIALVAVGFGGLLLLPTLAASILRWATATAQKQNTPVSLGWRTTAFFFSVAGIWGLVVYVWSCCAFSQSRGKSWAWGLLGLPAATSLVVLPLLGWPVLGTLCLLGLPGFLVPMSLKVDRDRMAGTMPVTKAQWLNRLATQTTWVWALGLFFGASWAYGNSFKGEMTLDNRYIIEEYFHQVTKMISTTNIYSWTTMVPLFFQNDYWWPKGISGLYRPVAVLSYWLNYTVNHWAGNDPLDTFQFHAVNLFLHWFTACLGFVLMRQLTRRTWVAFFTALLFVTHPIATESVSNIIGRSDILAAIATFGCLVLYIRSGQSIENTARVQKLVQWRIGPWLALFITMEVLVGLFLALGTPFSAPTWTMYAATFLAFAIPALGFVLTVQARRRHWARLPWLMAMMSVLAIGLFSKESAIAVVGLIVVYDAIYRWTLEDLRCAVPSLLVFSLLGAVGAAGGLWIGQFGALGLSEGLTPVLVILLTGSLLCAAGLVIAWVFWVMERPVSFEQLLGPWTKFFLPYLLFIPPIVLWLIARDWVFANATPPETPFLDNPIRGLGFLAARMTASDVFVRLLGLLVFPVKLSADYSFNQIPLFTGSLGSAETWLAMAGLLTLVGVILLIGFTFRSHKLICFLLVFYLLAYLPTSNFLIIIGSIMAERFLYLPLLAFVAFVVLGVGALNEWLGKRASAGGEVHPAFGSAIVFGLLSMLALGYGWRARFRNDDWLSDVTLWTAAADASPNSFRSYQSKAFALYEQFLSREQAGTYKDDDALRNADIDACYETAEHAKPIVDPLPPAQNSSRLYLHLGMYYAAKGAVVGHLAPNGVAPPGDPSLPWFRKSEKVLQEGVVVDRAFDVVNRNKEIARKIHPLSEISDAGLPPIYSTLGATYGHLGEWSKALQAFQYDRHLEPLNADAYLQIANCYANLGRSEKEAIAILQTLLLDGHRTDLWSPLAGALAQINHSGQPAVTVEDGKPTLHIEVPEVRSVVCSAYQGLVEVFLLAKKPLIANQFRDAATGPQWQFAPELFDGLVNDPDAEAPVPPSPD